MWWLPAPEAPHYLSLHAPAPWSEDAQHALHALLHDGAHPSRRAAVESNNILTGMNPVAFSTSDPIRLFIIQAVIIVCFTRALGWVGTYLRQPRVIAEVIGGILLGPTVFGRIPGFTATIFPAPSLPFLNLVSTLGLILFLFLVGLEVDFRAVRKCYKEALAVGVTGIVVPFALGAAISVGIYNDMIDHAKVSFGHFILFTGVAIAITAFPVLARILTEQKLTQTKVGIIVLAAGVGNDVVGWILLALTIALVNASSGVVAVYILLVALGWVLTLIFVVRPLLIWTLRRTGSLERGPSSMVLTATLLLVLVSAWFTDVIGVHPIFGAFFVGLIIPHEGGFAVALVEKVEDLVSALFLPIYFTLSGINTNLASLDTGTVWGYLIGVTVVAFTSKFLSCATAAKACQLNIRESLAVGTLMSCKGLVELIVLNVGLNAGILDTRTFSMFVVMALVSTVATTPLTIWAYPPQARATLDDQGNFQCSPSVQEAQDKVKFDTEQVKVPPLVTTYDDALAQLLSRPRRLRVVLDRIEHLPVLMTLVQFLGPVQVPHQDSPHSVSQATTGSRWSQDDPGQGGKQGHAEVDITDGHSTYSYSDFGDPDIVPTSALPRNEPSLADPSSDDRIEHGTTTDGAASLLSLDTLRMLELTDRTSTVMRASATEDTLRSDDVWAVFQTACQLSALPTRARVAVVNPTASDQAEAILARTRGSRPDTLWIPWLIPTNPTPGSGPDSGSGSGSGALGPSGPTGPMVQMHTALVRRLQLGSESMVATLLQRPLTQSSRARTLDTHHVCVAFFGGADARAALEWGLLLVSQNAAVQLTIVRLPPGRQGFERPGATQEDDEEHELCSTSDLVDNLAFDRLEAYLSHSAPELRQRIQVQVLGTGHHPLRTLLHYVTRVQPGLVLVGRQANLGAWEGNQYYPSFEAEQSSTTTAPATTTRVADDPEIAAVLGPVGCALHFRLAAEPFASAGRQLPPTVVLTSPPTTVTHRSRVHLHSHGGTSSASEVPLNDIDGLVSSPSNVPGALFTPELVTSSKE